MADEVVAGGEAGGNGGGPGLVLVDLCKTPSGATEWRGGVTHLIDLEPAAALAVTLGERATALVQPDGDGPLLMSPLCPLSGDLAAGSNPSAKFSRGAAVASHLGSGDLSDGIIVGPLALDRVGRGTRAETSVSIASFVSSLIMRKREILFGRWNFGISNLPRIGNAVDLVAGNSAVSGNLSDEEGGNGSGDRELHLNGNNL